MNILAFNPRLYWLAICLPAFLFSCKKKETDIYQMPDQVVTSNGAQKGQLKSDQEYISIMYSDLFNSTIPNNTLNSISNVSESFGDKSAVNELLLANTLKNPSVQIPLKSFMRAYPDSFVTQTYRKFYTRDPNEFERYYFVNLIQKDTLVTPELLYYTFGTSVEYRFY